MNIGYLMNTYPMSSTTFIRREIQALERLGWQIYRFAIRPDSVALVDAADIAEAARTEHLLQHGLRPLLWPALRWFAGHPRQSWAALWLAMRCGARGSGGGPGTGGRLRHLVYLIEAAQIARRCRDLAIGHLHAHFGTNAATVAMLAQALGGPSYSFTVHGPEEFDAPRALSLATKIDHAAFAVAISSFGRSQLCRVTPLADWPHLHVVQCGIEPWRFADPAPVPPGGPQLVAIGRLSEQKGFPLLIDAIAIACPHLPDLHLTLVGDGPLRPALTSAIAEAGLTHRVTLTGWLDETQVRARLAQATALILPSFAEGLPVVVMEAMASGRPVLATSVAGVPELVTPDCGWLVPAGDSTALAQAIVTLAYTPPAQLAEMGRAARARALARHSIDTEAAKLAALFASRGSP